jgi:hypothetical protein
VQRSPRGDYHDEAQRDCADGRCVVEAIQTQVEIPARLALAGARLAEVLNRVLK